MNTCRTIAVLLVGYDTRELSEFELRRVAAHLATCRACRDELARERTLRAQLRRLPAARCPDRVAARIAAAVDRDEGQRRQPALARPRVLAVTAMAVAAALLAVLLPPRFEAPLPAPAAVELAAATMEPADLDQARRDVVRALVFTADVIDRAERRVRDDMLRLLQPAIQAAQGLDTAPASPGGRG